MVKYNFVERDATLEGTEIKGERLRAEYKPSDLEFCDLEFDRAHLYLYEEGQLAKDFVIKNCLGSLILIDRSREGLNKLHIGELMIRNPHAETYMGNSGEGPRVDLHDFDLVYALERLQELESWRDPDKRRKLFERYATPPVESWYSTPHRLKQLRISANGLEQQIRAMERRVEELRDCPQATFVSDTSALLQLRYEALLPLMEISIDDWLVNAPTVITNIKKPKPKIIVDPVIMRFGGEMYELTRSILDFLKPRVDMQKASHYWQEVDSWENL